MVERLEAMGAIVVGKSNTPAFGAGSQTFNEVFGTTTTPFDVRRTCGGSSGGSASALASGQIWLATGTDLGGSLRIPASYCSVVGLRPSPGRVPRAMQDNNLASLEGLHSVNGPMARNVADVALFLDAMHGNAGWSFQPPAPKVSFSHAVREENRGAFLPRKVAFSATLGGISPCDPEVAALCEAASKWFAQGPVGAEYVNDCIDLSDAAEMFLALRSKAFVENFGPLVKEEKTSRMLKPEIVWNTIIGETFDSEARAAAASAHGRLLERAHFFFEDKGVDLLCLPCVMLPPFDAKVTWLFVFLLW
jgi:amidase